MSKAAITRLTILEKAFELIYRNGYQPTSIDTIISTTQVTKGAFFYHFKNKGEMGLALINEVINPGMYRAFVEPLAKSTDPIHDIYAIVEHLLLRAPLLQVECGCPAVNLANELSTLGGPLHKALISIMSQCQQAVQASLHRGQEREQIRKAVDPEQVAMFIMTGYSGIRNMGKLFGPACYHTYLRELKSYLTHLS